jgi:ABC-type amino acid transport substrate-binding protein
MNQLRVSEKEKNYPTFGRKNMRKKLSLLFAVLMSLSVLVAGSGAASANEDTSKLNLIKPGKLVVCMTLQFVPQMYLNSSGRPTGYDPDLVRQLARDLGLRLEIRNTDFTGLLAGIGSGQCDLASVGLGRTAAREQSMTYVKEYMPYNTVLASGFNDKSAATTTAWNVAAKKITCLKGSVSCTKVKEIFPNATAVEFTTQDGVIVETAIFGNYNKNNPRTLKIVKLEKDINRYFGWWTVRLGNTALQARLKQWVCDKQEDGFLARTYKRNMRQNMEPLPACTA